jgi:hypothetical protein
MTRLHRLAVLAYAGLAYLFPGEFRRRYKAEMQLDFTDEVHVCATAADLAVTAGRAYWDLVLSLVREWRASEALRLLVYAGLAHAGIWLIGVVVAAWQWPGGSRLYPVVVTFAVLSAPGIAVTVWRQRLRIHRAGCCSLDVAELD